MGTMETKKSETWAALDDLGPLTEDTPGSVNHTPAAVSWFIPAVLASAFIGAMAVHAVDDAIG
ncbi:hypothetical protein GCM10023329_40550 [Streptomyces sanyensis]|uniref:Uncharacterized protein n=2 Tax=Streptomyces TaxID=1883 RepID=A0ABP9AV04_9ACTN